MKEALRFTVFTFSGQNHPCNVAFGDSRLAGRRSVEKQLVNNNFHTNNFLNARVHV